MAHRSLWGRTGSPEPEGPDVVSAVAPLSVSQRSASGAVPPRSAKRGGAGLEIDYREGAEGAGANLAAYGRHEAEREV